MAYEIVIGKNERDRKNFGISGTIFLGKHFVKMGQITSLSNRVFLDIASSHVILVAGKRGSGKSYSLSVIAEEMMNLPYEVSNNLSVIMLDTMGIFWTMKYPNLRDEKLLAEWGLKPKGLEVNIYVPTGYYDEYKIKKLPVDFRFSLRTSEINASDWCEIFDIKITDPIGVLIEMSLEGLRERFGEGYDIQDIINEISKNKTVKKIVKDATINRFLNARSWGLFSIEGTQISELVPRGKISIIDLSAYSKGSGAWNIKSLVVGIIAKKLLSERIVSRKLEELGSIESSGRYFIDDERSVLDKPLVWVMIDESHEFLPKKGKTAATDALVQLLREGRQPGISIVLATQQPGEIHSDVLTQSDIVLSHRLTAKSDIDALNLMMQSYLLADIQEYMNDLPRVAGSAIILDDTSERIYPIKIRPKSSWHGGEAPSAIKGSNKLNVEIEKFDNLMRE